MIDTDLGISGKWGVAREGFTELVTRVCSGEVGAIFGIEITRLARSNADVARLAEFARITGTLLIDPDGVYDPADVNDRVLLGFKGTMGEMLCRYRHKTSTRGLHLTGAAHVNPLPRESCGGDESLPTWVGSVMLAADLRRLNGDPKHLLCRPRCYADLGEGIAGLDGET